MLPSATDKTQTPQTSSWPLLAESYGEEQVQQFPIAVKEIKHLYPTRRDIPTAVCPFVGKNSLTLKGRGEFPKFLKAKKKIPPIPVPVLPPITKRTQVPKNINWHLLGEPYRSTWIQQLPSAVKELGT